MEHVDTLIAARWTIPMEPCGQVLKAHAVAISRGRIVAIEPLAQARGRFAAAEYVERPAHVLLPGFINAHTHAAMTLLRSAAENATFDSWFRQQIQPLQARWIDAEYVRDGTRLAIADMLTSGTTCFADMHLFPEIVAQTACASRIRACVGLPVIEESNAWAGSADEALAKGLQLHDDYRADPLITSALAPYAPNHLSDETLLRIRRTADELELPLTMHVNETRADAHASGERSIARLARLGLLSPLLCAVHMVHATGAELDQAAAGGIHIVRCPQSNLKLGNGICPVPAIRARGVNLTLGTDGAASNNDLSMLDEMRTAALLANAVPGDAAPMSAHDWLQIATLNAARALGIGDAVGSIVPDKWADLCCIDLERPHTQPVYDPAAQVVYAASRDQVTDVWVAGRALLSEGRLTQMDLQDVLERAQYWQRCISGE